MTTEAFFGSSLSCVPATIVYCVIIGVKIMQIVTCIPRRKKLFMDFISARFYNIKLRQRNPFGALNQENGKECETTI